LGAVPFVSLRSDWKLDPFPALGWMPGTLAGVALFPAAYVAWDVVLGPSVIGLLPLLLGFHALLVTAVLIRAHGLRLEHPAVVVSVILVLAGVTFALPIQVQEKWLTVGWAMEGLALAWIGLRVRHPLARWGSVLLGVTVAVRLLANPWALEYGSTAGWPVLNWTLYTWGVPTLCLVGSAMGLERTRPEHNDGLDWAPQALRILAMLTGFALVNVEVSHAFQDAGPVELGGATMLQGMVRSLGWASWGLFLLVLGVPTRSRVTRFVGFAFLMLAAGKVFVYDIYSLPGFVRVGSFIGLGVLLIISALLFDRIVMRAGDPQKPEGA
ncbi:MAG: DUF2339 domain-containing protein, partial [Myxococcales bacterium]|nr:DUF2339 domain-containing protein [Myxococcales bacterium]